jgi:hypothetical protein
MLGGHAQVLCRESAHGGPPMMLEARSRRDGSHQHGMFPHRARTGAFRFRVRTPLVVKKQAAH